MKKILIITLFLIPQAAHSFCLRDCSTTNQPMSNFSAGPQQNEYRNRSHNFGDNSTAILGDVNIHVGHKRIDIRGMSDSKNSMIDASVTSVINLGNSQ